MFVVFDLETTGFNAKTDDIIQFAYIAFDNSVKVHSDILYFYYEGMSWSEEAYEVHHISKEFLEQHKNDFQKNLIRMFTVLGGSDCCGFNNTTFDCPFVQTWLARMGIPGLQFRSVQDIMLAYRPITHRPKISLVNLTELMSVSRETVQKMAQVWFGDVAGTEAHDASYDTAITAYLTILGINKGLVNFDDVPSTKEVEYDENRPTQTQLLDSGNATKVRDPKSILVFLDSDSGDYTNYLICSDKETYLNTEPAPFEVPKYIEAKKVFNDPFTEIRDNVWKSTATNGNVYTLTIGATQDSLTVTLADSGKEIKVF